VYKDVDAMTSEQLSAEVRRLRDPAGRRAFLSPKLRSAIFEIRLL
jgi:hypothetical protein